MYKTNINHRESMLWAWEQYIVYYLSIVIEMRIANKIVYDVQDNNDVDWCFCWKMDVTRKRRIKEITFIPLIRVYTHL